jgi:hypothetical protein
MICFQRASASSLGQNRPWSPRSSSAAAPGVRTLTRTPGAAAELDLGDQGRFWPSDDALARWKQIMPTQSPQVVYD